MTAPPLARVVCKKCHHLELFGIDALQCQTCGAEFFGYLPEELADIDTYGLLPDDRHTICFSCMHYVAYVPGAACPTCLAMDYAHQEGSHAAIVRDLEYRFQREEGAMRPVLRINGVSKRFGRRHTGLHHTYLEVYRGQLLAIMGPSGCGKSTLLKCLINESKISEGDAYLFDSSVKYNYADIQLEIGYVPQYDLVHENLTVEEAMTYSFRLKTNDAFQTTDYTPRFTETLRKLNLRYEDVRTKRIKELSGGQKKRVSIGIELLTEPKVLFLDEPTSPLDPQSIAELLDALRNLCETQYTTIVMVTHKPTDLEYADKVLFLASGGYPLYFGPGEELAHSLGKTDVVKVYEWAGNTANHEAITDRYHAYLRENRHPRYEPRIDRKIQKKTSFPVIQINILLSRTLLILWRDQKALLISFVQPIVVALLMGVIFGNILGDSSDGKAEYTYNLSFVFLTSISIIWFGINISAREIVNEIQLYMKEAAYNLDSFNYLVSKMIAFSMIGLAQVLIFQALLTSFMPPLQDFQIGAQVLVMWLMIYFISMCAGLLMSITLRTEAQVLSFIPLVVIPQIILSGVIAPIDNKATEIVSYFSLGRWATEIHCRILDGQKFLYANVMPVKPAFLHGTKGVASYMDALRMGSAGKELFNAFDSVRWNLIVLFIFIIVLLFFLFSAMSLKKANMRT